MSGIEAPGFVSARGDLVPRSTTHRQKPYRRQQLFLPWVVLIIGFPAAFFLFTIVADAVDDVARLRFERQASDARRVIDVRVHSYAGVLYGLKALFATPGSISRDQFHRFVRALDLQTRYPSLESVNYMLYVSAKDKNNFEQFVRGDTSLDPRGYPGFSIKPPGERPEYFVLVYLEPMDGFEFAFGRDLGANPAAIDPQGVAAAVRLTRDSGQLTASGLPLRMKGRDRDYTGLAMRLAVYRSGMPTHTVEQRQAAFIGSVGAGFNVDDLMQGVLDQDVSRYMRFTLYDAGSASEQALPPAPKRERLLFDSGPGRQALPAAGDPEQLFTRVLPIEIGGRIWELHFTAPKRSLIEPVDRLMPWVVFFGGLVSTILLSGLFYSLASSRSRAVAMADDITKDLRQSEASLAEAQRMAHLGNWSFDPENRMMIWSAETYRIFGLEPRSEPVPIDDFLRQAHPDDQRLVEETLLGASLAKEQRDIEHRVRAADGAVRWVHTIVQATSRDANAPVSGTMMDITERKLAEQELLESRALLIDAQKLANVGCCQYSPIDNRVIWSDELYRIHGMDAQSFVPTYESAMDRVHPDDRATWEYALARALRDGAPFTSEFRIVRPDSSVRHLRSLGEVIKDVNGRTMRMLWSVLDITEQKRTEDALRTSADQLTALSRRLVEVQEAERRQLSRELHDRVGQNLTALSINLDILRTSLSGDDCTEHRLRLSDSAALLESTVDSIEDVMAELRPPMLDDYGLLPALHWYAKDFSNRTGIEVDVLGSDAMERRAPEMEITLFRIAQEALNNVAKHARAKCVQIELDHINGHCTMTVTDNGIGIDSARRQRPGLGMVTMRERTQAVGGIFHVRTVPGGGTQIAVEIS